MSEPPAQFASLYDDHYRSVLGYALLRTDHETAQDVASETFLVAWRRFDDLPEPPLPWLLGVARNMLFKQYDSGRRRQAIVDRIAALTTEQDLTDWDVAEHLVARETALAALADLPERDVEALVLTSWHGLSAHDAARVIGCSVPAFTVRLHRARKRLAKALRAPETAAPGPGVSRRISLIGEEAR